MDSEEHRQIAEGFGADAATMKPFNREQFLHSIGRAMAVRAVGALPGSLVLMRGAGIDCGKLDPDQCRRSRRTLRY